MATILIVDDQPSDRVHLVTMLSDAGHTLLEASHSAEALAIVRSQRPDLIVAGLRLPVIDGDELVRQLRADPAIARTPVIYYTAALLGNEAHRLAQTVGVEHIVVMPAEPSVILTAIGAALAQPKDPEDGVVAPGANHFDREQADLLTDNLAHRVAELATANQRLGALLDLSQRLATKDDPAELLQTCCDAARDIIGVRRAVIQILGEGELAPRWSVTSDMDAGTPAHAEAAQLDIELLARIRASDRPVRASDSAASGHKIPNQRQLGRGFLDVPIGSAAERYGALCLIDKRDGTEFDREDERIAVMLAAQTAMAFENTQRFAVLRSRTQAIEQEIAERSKAEQHLRLYMRRLEALHVIDRAILAAHSPQAIAQAALPPIRQLIPSMRASIVGFDASTGEAEIWAIGSPWPSTVSPGMRFQLADQTILEALRFGDVFAIQDLRDVGNQSPMHRQLIDEGVRSSLSVPISIHGELIGWLNIASDQPGALAPDYQGVAQEIAAQLAMAIQNLRLFEQVRIGRERLQRLSQQLVQAQESERRHIARELHDEIGQSLTAAQLNLQVLVGISDLNELPDRLEDSLGLIDRVLQQVRTLSLDLRPSMLDDLGLVPALRWYANRQAERAGFKVELAMESMPERLPPDLETTCFRIAQEALNNIVRYAQAARVAIELRRNANILELRISDDGIGFDVDAALQRAAMGRSLGLVSMQERAALLGGMIQFDATPGQGTTIAVRLPLGSPAGDTRQLERRSSTR